MAEIEKLTDAVSALYKVFSEFLEALSGRVNVSLLYLAPEFAEVSGELHVNGKMCPDSSGTGFFRKIHLFVNEYEGGKEPVK